MMSFDIFTWSRILLFAFPMLSKSVHVAVFLFVWGQHGIKCAAGDFLLPDWWHSESIHSGTHTPTPRSSTADKRASLSKYLEMCVWVSGRRVVLLGTRDGSEWIVVVGVWWESSLCRLGQIVFPIKREHSLLSLVLPVSQEQTLRVSCSVYNLLPSAYSTTQFADSLIYLFLVLNMSSVWESKWWRFSFSCQQHYEDSHHILH